MSDRWSASSIDDWRARVESAYRQHGLRITGLLQGHHRGSIVEDSIQEVFLSLLARTEPIGADAEAMLSPSYLLVCVRRAIARSQEGAKLHAQRDREAITTGRLSRVVTRDAVDPAHRREPEADTLGIDQALAALPPKQRDLLMVLLGHEHTNQVAAKWLGVDANCVGARRHRAILRLRELLEEHDSEDRCQAERRTAPRRLRADGPASDGSDCRH